MAVTHRAQVFKTRDGSRFWTNIYHLDAADLTTALAAAASIATAERPLYEAAVTVARVLVHEIASGDFAEELVGLTGTGTQTGDLLPLWNVMRCIWTSTGINRPPQTLYRGVLAEDIVNGVTIASGAVSAFTTALGALRSAVTSAGATLVDHNGDPIVVQQVDPFIQMRQLHRKRRRTP